MGDFGADSLAEFTEAERERAGRIHTKFHKWELRTGTPELVVVHGDTLQFMERLVRFFATI